MVDVEGYGSFLLTGSIFSVKSKADEHEGGELRRWGGFPREEVMGEQLPRRGSLNRLEMCDCQRVRAA